MTNAVRHDPVPEVEYDCPGHSHYRCAACLRPCHWDGVFEGKWLHDDA